MLLPSISPSTSQFAMRIRAQSVRSLLQTQLPLILAAFMILQSNKLLAQERFIFWYPGESGNTEQAQPLMDLFAEYLDSRLPGTKWTAIYIPTEGAGKKLISNGKITAGIVSHLMITRYAKSLRMTRFASVRLLPNGDTTEFWQLVSGPCQTPPQTYRMFASEPLTPADLTDNFRERITIPTQIHPTTNLLAILRRIGQGSCDNVVISGRTWDTINSLQLPWSRSLRATASLKPHPSPGVVILRSASKGSILRLLTVLRHMDEDQEGKEILTELRLAGID